MNFTEDWIKKEIIDIDEGDFTAGNKLVLQILIFYLNFIENEGIKTIKDYNKFKNKLKE